MFAEGRATGFQGIAHDTYTTTEKDHGRLEIRRHWMIQDPESIAYLNPMATGPGYTAWAWGKKSGAWARR